MEDYDDLYDDDEYDDDFCDICGYEPGGSHYHCYRCGRVCSIMGHLVIDSDDFSCEPEDVERWEEYNRLNRG